MSSFNCNTNLISLAWIDKIKTENLTIHTKSYALHNLKTHDSTGVYFNYDLNNESL